MKNESKMLISNEIPLLVLPQLAQKIGINQAIFLQQLHYWVATYADGYAKSASHMDNRRDGYMWIYNTYEGWQKNFPWLSTRQIRRICKELEEGGVLITGNYNKHWTDRTKWYRINYGKVIEYAKQKELKNLKP